MVDTVDIGDDLNEYVDAILANGGDSTRMLVLQGDDGDGDVSMSQVMAEVALRVVERVFGPPAEWNLFDFTPRQWKEFTSLFYCTEWVPCVACPVDLSRFVTLGGESRTIPGHFLWQESDFDPQKDDFIVVPDIGADKTQLLMWMTPAFSLCG